MSDSLSLVSNLLLTHQVQRGRWPLVRSNQTYDGGSWDSSTQVGSHSSLVLPHSVYAPPSLWLLPVFVPQPVCPIHFSCQFLKIAIQKTFRFLKLLAPLRLYPAHTPSMVRLLSQPSVCLKPNTRTVKHLLCDNHCVNCKPSTPWVTLLSSSLKSSLRT